MTNTCGSAAALPNPFVSAVEQDNTESGSAGVPEKGSFRDRKLVDLVNENDVSVRLANCIRCRDRATKSAILARIQRQRLRKPKNQGRMSLTSRTYCECLFHTTTTESGWWGRNRSKLGAHHPVIEPVSNLTQGREFSMQTERQNRRVACVHAIHWLDPSYSRYAPPIKKRSSTILPFCTVYRPTSSRFKRLLPFGVTSILKRTTN